MSATIQPATDEQIEYIDGLDYGSISYQFANELVARIRVDAERIQKLEAELAKIRSGITAIDWLYEYDRANAAEARAAQLNESIIKMAKVMKEAVENCETCRGQVNGCARCTTFGNVCAEIDAALSAPDAQAGAPWNALMAEYEALRTYMDGDNTTSLDERWEVVESKHDAVEVALKGESK